jgi:tRNA/rRNA methyltransferase
MQRDTAAAEPGPSPLDRFVIVLHQPQDLVNIALVIRAMKNMGLSRLRLVSPQEFDPYRIEGIAHDTGDLVGRVEFADSLEAAIADATRVVGTSARRRASRQVWSSPEEAAPELVRLAVEVEPRPDAGGESQAVAPIAIVFGPEDRGLSNQEMDLCQEILSIPTSPRHPSMNLAHAALLVFYEIRRAADRRVGLPARDLSPGKDETAPPTTAGELERFFEVWERALERVGFFHHLEPEPKMRTFRSLFQRAALDRREEQLLEAVAWEIIHYERRLRIRLSQESEAEDDGEPAKTETDHERGEGEAG